MRNAAAPSQARPLLIGVGVVTALLVVIVAAGRYDRVAQQPPGAQPVTPGKIRVEGGPAPTAPVAAAPEAAPVDGVTEMPVQFYQVLTEGKEDAPAREGQLDVRPLPLPPPPGSDAEPAASLAPALEETPAPAAKPTPQVAARSVQEPPQAAPAPERAEAPVPAAAPPSHPAPAAKAAGPRPYSLQVGSFSQRDGADELADRLKGKGYEAYLVEVDLGAKGMWWRVRVGRYPTEYAAKWARLDLVKEGLSPIVVRDRTGS